MAARWPRIASRLGLVFVSTMALAVVLAGCAGPSAPASAPPQAAGVEQGSEASALAVRRSYALRLLEAIDAERAHSGMPPLRVATCVQRPAERWAARMAAGESLGHQSLGPIVRGCRARRAGEIVGSTFRSPDSLVQTWLASPRHRRTLLGTAFTHVGIGVEQAPSGRWFAVVDFAAF